jgi:exonuclease VII large subunit
MAEQYINEHGEEFTFERLWAMFQETDQLLTKISLEADQRQKEAVQRQKELDRQLKEMSLEADQRQKEADQRQKELDRQLKEMSLEAAQRQKELDRIQKETSRQVGDLGNSFGNMVEHLVAPNLLEKFNTFGYAFTKIGPNVKIKRLDKSALTQIDLLLENGDHVVVVEIKAHLTTEHIQEHIERLEKVRRYADEHNDRRVYVGAVAGAVVDDDVRDYAVKTGFFVIKQSGDTVLIDVPDGFKPRTWQ